MTSGPQKGGKALAKIIQNQFPNALFAWEHKNIKKLIKRFFQESRNIG